MLSVDELRAEDFAGQRQSEWRHQLLMPQDLAVRRAPADLVRHRINHRIDTDAISQ